MAKVLVLTLHDIARIVAQVGMDQVMERVFAQLQYDFSHWQQSHLSPRHAVHYPHGVMELMPFSTDEHYSYKFVNGHPGNPKQGKMTVVALGMLADVATGYPQLLSEMTVLTAIRTAVTSALASHYLLRRGASTMGLIGTGAQGEFQTLAHHYLCSIQQVRYFDIDPQAMQKYANNLSDYPIDLVACDSVDEVMQGVDMVTTATADKKKARILTQQHLSPGLHINGVGGDCPGKVELDPAILAQCKIVVEYTPQSREEGEIQASVQQKIHAELWELVAGRRPGRSQETDVTLFDSVGFALEDFSVLRVFQQLASEQQVGHYLPMLPETSDPKDLFGLLRNV